MKKLLSLLLVIATLLSIAACANTSDNGGNTQNVTTTATPTTAEPKVEDKFTFEKGSDGGYVLTSFSTNDEAPHEVLIPAEYDNLAVTVIGKDFAKSSAAISKVVIPDSVIMIEDGAFADCSSLEAATMSKNIKSIGGGAFKDCVKLDAIEIPWDTKLGKDAFSGCDELDRKLYIPDENETMYILMVGNSFCYYYPDELFGMAEASGIDMVICNVYYSGCTIETHYNWWQKNESHYEFYIYDKHGRRGVKNASLELCLSSYDWDVISIQDGPTPYRNGGISAAVASREPGLTELLKVFKERFPEADLYWHHFWSSQVGYEYKGYGIPTKAAQDKEYRDYCTLTKGVVTKHGLTVIPSGEAWEKARANELVGDTLCMADCHHEGEEGGGQYLNACVWFEMLTGRSSVGNPYRPSYNLKEEKIPVLQQAAHDAVVERKFNKK